MTNDLLSCSWKFKLLKWFFLVSFFTAPIVSSAQTEQTIREMQVKAAFLYNFTKFVYWKSTPETGTLSTITIGLIQADDIAGLLDDYISKNTSDSGVIIKRINSVNIDFHRRNPPYSQLSVFRKYFC